jgi:cytochrome P450
MTGAPIVSRSHPIYGLLGEFRRDALGMYDRIHAECGDIAAGRFFTSPTMFAFKPEYVRHVFQDNAKNYVKSRFAMDIIRFFSQENVFTSDGDFWLRQRRLMQPMFHRQRIAGFGRHIAESTQAMLRDWEARPGAELSIPQEMSRLTLRIVGLALFSEDLIGDAAELGRAFDAGDHYIAYRIRSFFAPEWLPTRWNRIAHAARHTVTTKVDALIAARRRDGHKDDLLSMLLEAHDEDGSPMSDLQVRREAQTMIAAGHETTSTALTWAWFLLSQHPDVEQRVRDEAVRVLGDRDPHMDDLPKLTYARQVIDESMRLFPPAWITSRDAAADDEIAGHPVRKGTTVHIPIWTIHRSPRYWDRPLEFDPGRFAPESAAKLYKGAYLPFGAGPRQCIGNTFALAEATLILAQVVRRVSLRLRPGHRVEPDPVLTLNVRSGLPMTAVAV